MTMPVTVQLDETLVKLVDKIAQEHGKTREEYIEETMEDDIAEKELRYIAESRAKEIREGRAKTISWEEVKRRNGLQD